MLSGMSVYSSTSGMASDRPMARIVAGLSAVSVSHAIDLAFFFPEEGDARPDMLIAETRRHLGGCITAIEMALRLSLDHAPDVVAALDGWPAPLAWPIVRAQPTLISPELLNHMRMRAGVTAMLRQVGHADVEQLGEGEQGVVPSVNDPQLGDLMSSLMLAEARWTTPGAEDAPMKADLPAEHFAELTWTVAACLAQVASRTLGHGVGLLLPAFDRSGWKLLGDHDEEICPISQADLLVRKMDERADHPELLGLLLEQRRFLLFAAVVARRLRMESRQIVGLLVMGTVEQLASLCRTLGGSDADYRLLLLALRPVRPALSDAMIVAEADRYRDMDDAQAQNRIAALRTSAALRAKVDHLHEVSGT
ncbi:hypothetical protein [Sphingobium sp.]|uniref:hypothetical protein n=1 Tax=Sphingobium sp. TaxID=1912891 RepID=UPI003B3AF3E0